jgi:hypothetical protein
MGDRRKSFNIKSEWPTALVMLGIALTLVWSGLLVWLVFHLLHVV